MHTSIAKNLADLMHRRRVNQVDLALASGVRQSTISRILRPAGIKGIKSPTDAQVKPLADFFGVTTDQLRGYVPFDETHSRRASDRIELAGVSPDTGHGRPLDADEVLVPLYQEVDIADGDGSTVIQRMTGATVRLNRAILDEAGVLPENAVTAVARGNSMARIIMDGSTVGIDKGTLAIADGEIYAIDHDGMLRIKYLYRLPGGGIRLRSENNQEHPDEIIPPSEMKHVRVLGWVFWWSTVRKRSGATGAPR